MQLIPLQRVASSRQPVVIDKDACHSAINFASEPCKKFDKRGGMNIALLMLSAFRCCEKKYLTLFLYVINIRITAYSQRQDCIHAYVTHRIGALLSDIKGGNLSHLLNPGLGGFRVWGEGGTAADLVADGMN